MQRNHQFDTVLGTIGFDEKGDVTGYEPFAWYVWKGGHYVPLEEEPPSNGDAARSSGRKR